jgi:hypothetical protein
MLGLIDMTRTSDFGPMETNPNLNDMICLMVRVSPNRNLRFLFLQVICLLYMSVGSYEKQIP